MIKQTINIQDMMNENDSKRITALRFILAFLVVTIHCNLKKDIAIQNGINFQQGIIVYNIKEFIAGFLASSAVPLFFLFSGYLSFYNLKPFKEFILKKIKSILIPFFIWSIITLIIYATISFIPKLQNLYFDPSFDIKNWKSLDYFKILYNKDYLYLGPIQYQFWYLRELFIYFLISPLLVKIFQDYKIKYFVLLILFVLSFSNFSYYKTGEFIGFFYFCTGIFYAVNKKSFFDDIDKISFGFYLILALIVFILRNFIPIGQFSILISSLLILRLSDFLIKRNKIYNFLAKLSKYSFFIYAIHAPFLKAVINKISYKIFTFNSIGCLFQFICVNIVVVTLSIFIGWVLNLICPKLFKLINGR